MTVKYPQTAELIEQRSKITGLLRNKNFALELAEHLHQSYLKDAGQAPAPLISQDDEHKIVESSLPNEKIAINLAGFYALECGVASLTSQTGETFIQCLRRIVSDDLHGDEILLLNHFANTTWKAGQPFRDLKRIERPVFAVFSSLPADEQQKDLVQIRMAAEFLRKTMSPAAPETNERQLEVLKSLIQSRDFAVEMAIFLDGSYYAGQGKTVPPFISREEELEIISKPARDQHIAVNLAGFYALESGLDYFSTIQSKLPSEIIQAIVDDKLLQSDKDLFCRLANAAWKAGQPFRDLDRITRPIFVPFDLLSKEDVAKDWTQIKGAAEFLKGHL